MLTPVISDKQAGGAMSTAMAGVPKSDWSLPSRPGLQIEDVSRSCRESGSSILLQTKSSTSQMCCTEMQSANGMVVYHVFAVVRSHHHMFGVAKTTSWIPELHHAGSF